jgi:hypothetical protein
LRIKSGEIKHLLLRLLIASGGGGVARDYD